MIALKNTTDKQVFYILKKSTRGFHPYFDLTSLSVEYTENGQYSILPPTGYDGLSKVNVTVDVAGSCNLTTSTATITEGGIQTITPPSGYDGFTEVTVDTSNVYDNGKQDGIDEQKSKLTSGSFTENGTYNREDGWNAVTVNVDTQTPYDNGFADGEDAQKAKLSSLNVTANGTYSREDGYNEVTVAVPSVNNQNKAVNPSTTTQIISADSGYSGLGQVTVNAVTASIDPDIQPSNILEGVNILGVEGSDRGYDAGYSEGYDRGILEAPCDSCCPAVDIRDVQETYTSNGQYTIVTPSGADGISNAFITVNVPSFPDLSVIGWTRQMIQDAGIQNDIDNTAIGRENYPVFASTTPSSQSGNARLCYVPEWDTSGLTDMSNWFDGCTALMHIPQLDTSNVVNASNMFKDCSLMNQRLTLDLSSCTNAIGMFENCYYLPMPVLQNTGNITDMSQMFSNCGRYLISVNDSISLDTSSCVNMSNMFGYCQGLVTVGELDCSNVYNVSGMFFACDSLQNLGGLKNLGQAFTGNIVSYHQLNLFDCPSLTTTATHNVLDKLGTVSVTASVKFDPDVYDALDPADIASATAKGWAVIAR